MDGDELFIGMEYMEGGALTDLVLTVNLELKYFNIVFFELDTGVLLQGSTVN